MSTQKPIAFAPKQSLKDIEAGECSGTMVGAYSERYDRTEPLYREPDDTIQMADGVRYAVALVTPGMIRLDIYSHADMAKFSTLLTAEQAKAFAMDLGLAASAKPLPEGRRRKRD